MPTFRPSHLSFDPTVDAAGQEPVGYGSAGKIVAGAGAAVSAGVTGVTTTTLLVSGAAAATVPVLGWIVGGVLAATAGTIAIVKGIRERKVNKAAAIKWARGLGLPDPEKVPGFVIRLSKKPQAWRRKKLALYKRRLKAVKKREAKWRKRPGARRVGQVLTLGILRGPARLKKQKTRLEAKVALIEALEGGQQRRAPRREQTPEETAEIRQAMTGTPASSQGTAPEFELWQGALAVVVLGGVVVAVKARQARQISVASRAPSVPRKKTEQVERP